MSGSGGQYGGPMESHKQKQMYENIDFLLDVGLHKEQIARRLGLTRDGLDKMLERRSSAERDSAATAGTGEAQGHVPLSQVRRSSTEW